MTTPSLRDAQIQNLIVHNERLLAALNHIERMAQHQCNKDTDEALLWAQVVSFTRWGRGKLLCRSPWEPPSRAALAEEQGE